MESVELLGEQPHDDQIAVPPVEEHVLAQSAFFDEAQSAVERQRGFGTAWRAARASTASPVPTASMTNWTRSPSGAAVACSFVHAW
ncbi:hypothetical protein [Streptomyces huasconensis]|uniref:hypothetical protein n=1 Tax=Streptomyces huasconensis TaxID=1854574 RepID=UPI0037000A27